MSRITIKWFRANQRRTYRTILFLSASSSSSFCYNRLMAQRAFQARLQSNHFLLFHSALCAPLYFFFSSFLFLSFICATLSIHHTLTRTHTQWAVWFLSATSLSHMSPPSSTITTAVHQWRQRWRRRRHKY